MWINGCSHGGFIDTIKVEGEVLDIYVFGDQVCGRYGNERHEYIGTDIPSICRVANLGLEPHKSIKELLCERIPQKISQFICQ